MKPKPFNVYSPEKCDERIDKLILELENEDDVVKINKRIAETSGGYFLFTCDASNMLNEVGLFRVTRPYSDLYSNMDKPKSFSYNPFMSTQRANREGFPVFYGSFSKRTAMEEVNLKPGEEFYISRWNVLPAEIIRIFLLAYDSDERGGVFDEMIEENINTVTSNLGEDAIRWTKHTHRRVIDLFTLKDSKYYNITSGIGHQKLYHFRGKVVDTPVILFPSVAKKGNEYNLAIHPSFANDTSKLMIETVLKCTLADDGKNSIIHAKGINIKGLIKWGDLQVKLKQVETNNIEIQTSLKTKSRSINTKNSTLVSGNVEANFNKHLKTFVNTEFKKHVESEMHLNLDLFDIFKMEKEQEIEEVYTCPFPPDTTLKETGERIEFIKLNIKYTVGI